jgi:hypothetical protein
MARLLSYGKLREDCDSVIGKGFVFDRMASFSMRSAAKLGFSFGNKVRFDGKFAAPKS